MRRWDHEQLFYSGDHFFSSLIHAIANAQRSVDLEMYIFRSDALGDKILETLAAAAKRGVRVRLMIDGMGSSQWRPATLRLLQDKGIEAKIYHRVYFLSPLRNLNRRNHRKVCVVDEKTAFVGGMNVDAVYLKTQEGDQAWRDTSVLVKGHDIQFLKSAFEKAWFPKIRAARDLRLNEVGGAYLPSSLIRLNDSWRRRRGNYLDLIDRIVGARHHVWITSPYFVPARSLLRALRFSSQSGVDVRLLVPARNDIFFMRWVNGGFYSTLLKMGVKIYEYLPSTLHSKTVIIDNWATVGSSNLNHRSLIHDLEVDVTLTDPSSMRSLHDHFLDDVKKSAQIEGKTWGRRSLMLHVLEWLLLKLKYWL